MKSGENDQSGASIVSIVSIAKKIICKDTDWDFGDESSDETVLDVLDLDASQVTDLGVWGKAPAWLGAWNAKWRNGNWKRYEEKRYVEIMLREMLRLWFLKDVFSDVLLTSSDTSVFVRGATFATELRLWLSDLDNGKGVMLRYEEATVCQPESTWVDVSRPSCRNAARCTEKM